MKGISDEPTLMRSKSNGFTTKVLPEFIKIYLEEGWVIVNKEEHEVPGDKMSDREELFQIIWDGAVDDRVKDGKSPEKVPVVRPKVWALVHGILAAGFRKPRIVKTSDELDALSNKALIMTRHGEYREAAKTVLSGNIWRGMGPTKVLQSAELAASHLPATVLHEGEES